MYSTRCKICKTEGKDTRYIGETSRSLYERLAEHVHDAWNKKDLSHMRTHLVTEHQMDVEPKDTAELARAYEVHIEKGHKTAMARQVHEAITIGRQGTPC